MWARHRLEWVTAVVAAVLGVGYLILPPMGSDLAAQVARAGFFADHGWTPIDLRWYGGVDQLGYSLVSQPVMALLGVRVTGAVCLLVSALLFSALLQRTGAARPWLGSVLGAVCVGGNLVSGRVTYALGVTLGLAALLLLTFPRLRRLAIAAALLASATSPVAGLFLGLIGAALLLSRRIPAGLLIAVPAAVPLGVSALFLGDGGWMNISVADTTRTAAASLLVAALVPLRPVRIAGVLSAAGVLAAALIHTPVGLNATRLAVMFTIPVLAAYATLPRRAPAWTLAPLLVLIVPVLPPVVINDVRDIGNPTADRAYFTPLLDRLRQERLTGRVEIPSTRDYWEAAHLDEVPLARGWLRQADIARDPLFFTDIPGMTGTGVALTADSYRTWLTERAVQFVAVPDAEFTWSGRPEAELVTAGLPYLEQVWSSAHWRLYAVADPQPIVPAPATTVAQDATGVTFDAPGAMDLVVRVHYYRWLRVSGARLSPSGEWTLVRVPRAGRYTLTSSLT